MIPLKIQIKNFLSYGSCQTIDISPYHFMCLTGKNGHGKSALLDAITWALWGQARKVPAAAKPDEKLLRIGSSHMFVTLDFISQGQTYRVRREYAYQHGKGTSYLDFGIIQENGQFKSLTDKTIKNTQYILEKTICLSFETFVNSAFLRQGQSNEFSRKTPQERKEILTSMLGLSIFETIRKKAHEKAREFGLKEDYAKQHILNKQEQLPKQDLIILQETQLSEEKNIFSQQSTELEQALLLNKTKQDEETKKIQSINAHIQYLTQLKTHTIQQQQNLFDRIQAYRSDRKKIRKKQILNIEDIRAQFSHLDTARRKKQDLEITLKNARETVAQKKQLLLTLYEEMIAAYHKKTESLHQLKARLETETLFFRQEISALHATMQSLKKQHSEYSNIEEQSNKLENDIYTKRIFIDRLHSFIGRWESKQTLLLQELHQLDRKKKTVEKSDTSCPLCDQSLEETYRLSLQTKFSVRKKIIERVLTRMISIIPTTKLLSERLIKEVKSYDEMLRVMSHKKIKKTETLLALEELQKKEDYITQKLTSAESSYLHIIKEFQAIEKPLSFEELLNQNKDYTDALKNISDIERDVAALKYDEHLYQEIISILPSLHPESIQQEKQSLEVRKREILEEGSRVRQCKTKIKEIKNLEEQASFLKKTFDSLIIQEQQHKQAQHLSQTRIYESETKLAVLEHEKKRMLAEIESINELKKQCILFQDQKEDYLQLSQALSKEGIQALLIEQALPEIEYEANHLLSKLTEHHAHITIEPLKDLKSGKSKETLDITIADSAGVRPYELFSGGEAFRIDFALRIALAKLLARRSGTTLQTLIIDEGFGSQDEEGLQQVTESLYKIQHEFAKIIVVSHLPSMKEHFPVHLHVTKDPEGSSIRVQHMG